MVVNGLKAWFGENATPENEFGYGWLPKKNAKKDYGLFGMIDDAYAGKLKLAVGPRAEPAGHEPEPELRARGVREARVPGRAGAVGDGDGARSGRRPGVDPKAIQTEVLLLPAAYFMEKEGTITNSGAMVQWRYAAVKPPGEARADLEVIDEVFRRVRALYADSTDPKDAPILKAAWDYRQETLPRTCSRRSTAAPARTSRRRG